MVQNSAHYSSQGKVEALIRRGSLALLSRCCFTKITAVHLNLSKLFTKYCWSIFPTRYVQWVPKSGPPTVGDNVVKT